MSDPQTNSKTSYSANFWQHQTSPCLEFAGPTWDLVLVDVVAQVNNIDLWHLISKVTTLFDGGSLGFLDNITRSYTCSVRLRF